MGRIDYGDWRVRTLLAAVGVPYVWAAGDLRNAKWIADGYDCSGFAQAALVELGIVDRTAWVDETANGLANRCNPVSLGNEAPGDLAFYGKPGRITHVTVCLGAGQSIGANGGRSSTKGDDPKACVQVRPVQYRKDLVVIGTIKPKFRKG